VKNYKEVFFRNWKVKISIFLVAVFLWFFIMIGGEYDAVFHIPLEMVGKKPSKVLVAKVPETVKVECHDTGKQLLMFQFFSDAVLQLDISTINYFYDYPLREDQITLPGGFYPHSMSILEPDTVNIRLDDLEAVRVPIVSRVAVVPRAGFVLLGEPKLSLDSVSVRGARRYVQTVREVVTDSVVFDNASDDLRAYVPLKVIEETLIYGIQQVEVTAQVDRLGQIDIPNVPVHLEAVPEGRQVIADPPYVTLTVKGAASLLKRVRRDSVRAVINFGRMWDPANKMYLPQVSLPEGIELIAVTPERVQLNVIKKG
jgi:hypothetical protein